MHKDCNCNVKKEKEKKEEPDEGKDFLKALKDARDKGEKTVGCCW